MSPPAMSFGDLFCMSRKGGQGEGGLVHPDGKTAWPSFLLGVKIPQ